MDPTSLGSAGLEKTVLGFLDLRIGKLVEQGYGSGSGDCD